MDGAGAVGEHQHLVAVGDDVRGIRGGERRREGRWRLGVAVEVIGVVLGPGAAIDQIDAVAVVLRGRDVPSVAERHEARGGGRGGGREQRPSTAQADDPHLRRSAVRDRQAKDGARDGRRLGGLGGCWGGEGDEGRARGTAKGERNMSLHRIANENQLRLRSGCLGWATSP